MLKTKLHEEIVRFQSQPGAEGSLKYEIKKLLSIAKARGIRYEK